VSEALDNLLKTFEEMNPLELPPPSEETLAIEVRMKEIHEYLKAARNQHALKVIDSLAIMMMKSIRQYIEIT
jgi:hypothetical protein